MTDKFPAADPPGAVCNAASPQSSKRRILQEVFGYDSFRPSQETVIDLLLAGHSVLAVMPTGAGKSLCYQVPALMREGVTVVISPLIALMRDQVSALKLSGVAADTINSSSPPEQTAQVWGQLQSGQLKLLYVSPEKLMSPGMLDALQSCQVNLIAVDEAHCISQWGPAFRPEYADLARLRELFPRVPTLATTATADEVTRSDIVQRLFNGDAQVQVQGFDRPNIKLSVAPKSGGSRQLRDFLMAHQGSSGIVYCLSRKKTVATAAQLRDWDFKALAYHAGMDASEREKHQGIFMTEPAVVMVATIAFGMGIDKPDIRFVLHTDMPGSIEAYYQEIGRAGRDGEPAEALLLFGLDDIRLRRLFIDQEDAGEDRQRREHQRLSAMIGYCETPICRRRTLLAYFGEHIKPCGHCDTCLNPAELIEATEYARMALSAIYRTRQLYGVAHIVEILRGQATAKVIRAGHDQLPTFGVGKELPAQEWRALIRQLVSSGCLLQDISAYGSLKITAAGIQLLKGNGTFKYRQLEMTAQRLRSSRSERLSQISELSPEAQTLLDRLKRLRLKLARERSVPAYVIFPDRSLIMMAQQRPATHQEFSKINGVGASKLRDFADVFIDAIADERQKQPDIQ